MATAAAVAAVVEAAAAVEPAVGRARLRPQRERRRPPPPPHLEVADRRPPTADRRPPSVVSAADVLLAIRDTPPGTDSRAADRPSPSRRPAEPHTRELTLCRTHPRVPQVRTPRTSTYGSAV